MNTSISIYSFCFSKKIGFLSLSLTISISSLIFRGGLVPKLLIAAAVLAGGAFAVKSFNDNKQNKEKKEEPKKATGGLGWGKK